MTLMKTLWLLIATFSVSSCQTIPDFEACGDLTRGRGYCTTVLSHKERVVPRSEWARLSKKAVKIPAKDYGSIKKYVIKQCKRNKRCVEKHKIKIDGTFRRLDKAIK